MLGIDTSGKTASAALYDTESGIFLAQYSLYTQKTHSQVIMPICRDIISQAGKKIEDIGALAVAKGPGSYTGLRIGAAAVKAMCFALNCKCCGVSTLEGLAYNNLQFNGVIVSVMKARGDLVYGAVYRSNGSALEEIWEEKLVPAAELEEYLDALDEKYLICGDGSEEFLVQFPNPKGIIAPASARLQNAVGICLAAANKELITAQELEVSYLQKVKAEKDLEEKNKSQ